MNRDLEKLSAALLRPEERAGAHAGVFEHLGFSAPAKAASLWGALVMRTGFSAPPGGAGPAIEAHVSHLIEELSVCPDPDMALLNLSRFIDAVISPSQFFGSLLLEKPLIHLLAVIFSCSYYLSDILVRNPVYISWLIARETLESFKSYRVYRDELDAQISPFTDRRRRLNSIKRYRRRELLRIGTRDLLGLAAVEEVTAELSFLADAVVGAVTGLAYDEEARKVVITRAGRPLYSGGASKIDTAGAAGEDTGEQRPICFEWDGAGPFRRFAVISLGKLGGSELNYSSDIDLMFICDAAAPLEEKMFYTALARRITADLSEPTEEGYLYRVDLRLRPDGESGPIVVTTEEHVNYLIRRGRPWERQALLKARHSAGSCTVADTFIDNCNRVVFSTLGDDNPLPEILTMRERAIAQLPPEERSRNIKLMSGGIRDIEFIAQALQLVHGRSRPEVRSRNTLEALERLHHYGLLEDEALESLTRCYRLFRTVEHRLQMLLDVRTHTLPEDDGELERLGARIVHSALYSISAGTFRTELGRAIRQVQKLFDAFFRDQKPDEIPLILSLPPGEKEVSRALARYGMREGETAHRFLSSLVYGDFPNLEHPETLHAAAAALPVILEEMGRTPDPTLALKNLVRIVKSTGAVRSTLELLGGGGDFLRLMLVIAALSTKLTDVISHRPELLDALALGFRPDEPPKYARDEDALALGLKKWYGEMLLNIHCQHPIPENGPDILGPLFSDALERAVGIIFDTGRGGETGMALFALGSLAWRRCRLGSDLDLLAVIPDGVDPRPTAGVLRGIMSVMRQAGIATVDPRLRGEGEGSPLAQTLAYYRRYFESRADFWELLTFSRCRFLCGDEETGRMFDGIVGGFHERDDVKNSFRAEFLASRERLERLSKGAWDVKHAPGGLYDINFILASVNLLFPPGGLRAISWDDSIEILQSKELLRPEEIDNLARAFKLYYLAQHAAALHGIAYPPLPEREAFLESYCCLLLAPLTGGTEEPFTNVLQRFRKDTRNVFLHYIERIP